jgi:hypothetical protein
MLKHLLPRTACPESAGNLHIQEETYLLLDKVLCAPLASPHASRYKQDW